MKTLEELKDYISHNVPEVDLLELLDISSEDLVNKFQDEIEEKYNELIIDLELEERDD